MKTENKITEQPSRYDHLEQMSVAELLQHINEEDMLVAEAVRKAMPQIQALVEAIEPRMKRGGRLFYVGAGTSGRLGVLDASELPPTFGVPEDWVIGLIAGGDKALRHAVENAEDIAEQGWKDLASFQPTADDTVIGIAASGTTPYVIGAVLALLMNLQVNIAPVVMHALCGKRAGRHLVILPAERIDAVCLDEIDLDGFCIACSHPIPVHGETRDTCYIGRRAMRKAKLLVFVHHQAEIVGSAYIIKKRLLCLAFKRDDNFLIHQHIGPIFRGLLRHAGFKLFPLHLLQAVEDLVIVEFIHGPLIPEFPKLDVFIEAFGNGLVSKLPELIRNIHHALLLYLVDTRSIA